MSKRKPARSPQTQINDMFIAFAGEKLEKVQETAKKLVEAGKSQNRARADALELHKCPNTFPDVVN